MAVPKLTRAQRRQLLREEAKRRQGEVQQVSEETQGLPLSVAELLQREAPGAVDRIPAALRATLTGVPVLSFTAIAKMHSGPLPAAEDIAAYAQIIPNGADRIMAMAERQQTHRIRTEDRVISHQLMESGRGQLLGYSIAVLGMIITAWLLANGQSVTGTVFGGGTFTYLVWIFVLGKQAQSRSLASKRTESTQRETNMLQP